VIEPFRTPTIGTGRMPGSRHGPLMPVGVCDASSTRSGLPRCMCLGFQVSNGELIGPADMFDDIGFDRARARCSALADLMSAQGPFDPPGLSRTGTESSLLPEI
jgi:fructose 1,6-bisphosphate aldolase/phosphatase